MSEPTSEVSVESCDLFRKRVRILAGAIAVLCLLFGGLMVDWVEVALRADLHSHVLLIPAVVLYLIFTEGGFSRSDSSHSTGPSPSPAYAAPFLLVSVIGWAAMLIGRPSASAVDLVALGMVFFLCGVWGVVLLVMGWPWAKTMLFPLAFLVFMIPLPGFLEGWLEKTLMVPSAWISEWLFDAGGIAVHRQGQVLELPVITLEVAQECSGIRSTLVLLITSILAAHLFLRDTSSRLILVLSILPLGVVRNAARIFVIGWLCVNHGVEQIDSWIHRQGGPVFFVLSLIPLLLAAFVLWRVERSRRSKEAQGASSR